ncbi:hydrogen peroxide-inducible genes activator [Polymorphum gilvum]|uniref:Transcription factor OxyR n=1 Tax=Polymorphum gilvum (strain LMG 25793 / CGMCC 1.9160 / SL003B-26A1) TaxID=991905 RepID=F2J1E7_POLGS|nr:hydrogen peroxide-inducible genes activator [Polymorphum gilvum]ADZ69729.1 Transcription factor OxyR [Polymorphum gilvum SL003B-26A1]
MPSLRQFRYLDALATHLHFRRAADAVAVSQPALSMQIRELEQELEIKLVERQPNAVRLTREGEEIVTRARKILSDVRDLVDYARQLGQPLSGTLRLGIIPSIAPYLLPRILPALGAAHPNMQLTIRETLTEAMTQELLAGDLDAIIVALPVTDPGLVAEPLFVDRFLLARHNRPGLDCSRPVEPADLETDTLLLLEEGHCLRDQALNYCSSLPTGRKSPLGATSLATVMQMVAAGYGVTLLPEICAATEVRDDRVALLRFADPQPARTVGLAWRKSSPRRQDFETLRQTLMATLEGCGCAPCPLPATQAAADAAPAAAAMR